MVQIKLFIFLFVWCTCFKVTISGLLDIFTAWNKPNIKRDVVYDFMGLVERHNYPAEEHKVKTADGYKLVIHRIPGSPKSPKKNGKPVIFLQHGILGSSDMFVIAGPNRDLAFLLADAGYDVWLGNTRGNVYSRKHETKDPDKDLDFWDFSFHEIAIYDMTAVIDFVLAKTNQTSLVYIGHSMATTESLVLLSEKPRYNEKIRLAINMAPLYRWREVRNFVKFLKKYWTLLHKITFLITGTNEILPLSRVVGQKANTVCNEGSILQVLCQDIAQYISGFSKDVMDIDLLTESFSYFPAGTSRRSFMHYNQNIEDGQLQMYDYGLIQNFIIYHKSYPPVYDLSKITTPIYMFYGHSDAVATPHEAIELSKVLKNATAEAVANKKFGHVDFLWAKNAKSLLYDRVMEIIAKHVPNVSEDTKIEL